MAQLDGTSEPRGLMRYRFWPTRVAARVESSESLPASGTLDNALSHTEEGEEEGDGAPTLSSSAQARQYMSLALLLVDLLALGMTLGDLHGPIRFVSGLILGAVIPGWSVVGLLRLSHAALEIALSVTVSFTLLMIAAQIILTVHAWHLLVLEEVTCMACLPSLFWQSFHPFRTRTEAK
jgi:hypothetical protein